VRYKAVLLDFDNTIIGSEKDNHRIFKEVISGLIGRELTGDDSIHFADQTWIGIFETLHRLFLPEMTPAEIRSHFTDAKAEYFKNNTAPLAAGLSDVLRLDMKKAIVTGSSRKEVEMFKDAINLEKFDVIASDECYKNGKPAPDAYAFAVKAFGLKAEECLAVEDSAIGLKSAGSAGCATVFTKEFTCEDHSRLADYIVSDVSGILPLLTD